MKNLSSGDIILIVVAVLGVLGAALYFLNRWSSKKMGEQEEIVEKSKQLATIYVIDKQKMKAAEANLPKAVAEKLPRIYKILKMPLVKAKIGPQILTLMCDKKVFDALPVKKSVKVEIAGIYIVSMKGMKTKEEMKANKMAKEGNKKPWYKFW